MLDRVPLEKVVDKSEAERPPDTTPDIQAGPSKGIDELQALRHMSEMFGFDGTDFEGMGREAEFILGWAKESGNKEMMFNKLSLLKSVIGKDRGKEFLTKAYRWVKLSGNIDDLMSQRRSLENSERPAIMIRG